MNPWIVVAYAIVMPPALIWEGHVFRVLWGWFVVPAIHAPSITLPQAIGIGIVARYMMPYRSDTNDKRTSERKLCDRVALWAIGPPTALGLGWIVRLFL